MARGPRNVSSEGMPFRGGHAVLGADEAGWVVVNPSHFAAACGFSIFLETSTPRGRTMVAFSTPVVIVAVSASRRRPAVPVVWEEVSLRLGTSLRGRFRRRGRVPILWVVANVGSDAVEVGRFSEDLVVEPRLPVEIGS